jgi:hypothetical protein
MSDGGSITIYVSRSSNTEVLPGSGYNALVWPTYRASSVWMQESKTQNIHFDGDRHMSPDRGTEWHVTDYRRPEGDHCIVARFSLDSGYVGGVELRGKALILVESGDLWCVDPYTFEAEPSLDGAPVLTQKQPHFFCVLEGISSPIGICRLPDNRVAIWTDKEIMVVEFDEDWKVAATTRREAQGIVNVRYDRKNNRLVVAHRDHLAYWGMPGPCFHEQVRLYLLPGGGTLVHAIVPECSQTGPKANRPDYIWSDRDCRDVFENAGQGESSDGGASTVRQPDSMKQFRFDGSMVGLAVRDYERFLCEASANA